jgi:hypothetical protein
VPDKLVRGLLSVGVLRGRVSGVEEFFRDVIEIQQFVRDVGIIIENLAQADEDLLLGSFTVLQPDQPPPSGRGSTNGQATINGAPANSPTTGPQGDFVKGKRNFQFPILQPMTIFNLMMGSLLPRNALLCILILAVA